MAGEKGDLAYLQLNFSSRYRLLRVKVGKGENAKQWMKIPFFKNLFLLNIAVYLVVLTFVNNIYVLGKLTKGR